MSGAARRLHHTYAEYVSLEQASPIRHEFLGGEIYAMAGGTPDHAALAASVLRLIGNQLPAGCRTFTADLRLHVAATGLTTYADGAVVCGRSDRSAEDPLAVTNPILVIEVTSPSSEDYDRGAKLQSYQQLPSVREILIVSHRRPELTLARRTSAGWTEVRAVAGETLALESVPVRLSVDEIYRDGLEDAGR